MFALFPAAVPLAIFAVVWALSCLKVINEYERAVVFTLGKAGGAPKGPGLVLVWRPFQRAVLVSLRTTVLEVPSQDVITRDNVSLKVSAVVYSKVLDPRQAIIGVEDFAYATSQIARTTLRSILGEVSLDELLASQQLLEAANKISQYPVAIQMRYLQALTEIAVEKNSTIVFPLPMELMTAFEKMSQKQGAVSPPPHPGRPRGRRAGRGAARRGSGEGEILGPPRDDSMVPGVWLTGAERMGCDQ